MTLDIAFYLAVPWYERIGVNVWVFRVYFYYLLGKQVNDGLSIIKTGATIDISALGTLGQVSSLLKRFGQGLDDENFPERLKSSRDTAFQLAEVIDRIVTRVIGYIPNAQFARIEVDSVESQLAHFESMLVKELGDLPVFAVGRCGNLSVHDLVNSSSSGYSSKVTSLLDDFVKQEIDEAGRCLAFNRPTACGFHIFRAVEICLKAYVLAATGALPKLGKRNWGEYIAQLTGAGATSDLVDLLRILKTKRNPLMHPQDSLDTDDAIGIFCICESAIGVIVSDIKSKGLETKFTAALAALPTT